MLFLHRWVSRLRWIGSGWLCVWKNGGRSQSDLSQWFLGVGWACTGTGGRMIKVCGGVHFYFIISFVVHSVVRTALGKVIQHWGLRQRRRKRMEKWKRLFLDGSSGGFICLNLWRWKTVAPYGEFHSEIINPSLRRRGGILLLATACIFKVKIAIMLSNKHIFTYLNRIRQNCPGSSWI